MEIRQQNPQLMTNFSSQQGYSNGIIGQPLASESFQNEKSHLSTSGLSAFAFQTKPMSKKRKHKQFIQDDEPYNQIQENSNKLNQSLAGCQSLKIINNFSEQSNVKRFKYDKQTVQTSQNSCSEIQINSSSCISEQPTEISNSNQIYQEIIPNQIESKQILNQAVNNDNLSSNNYIFGGQNGSFNTQSYQDKQAFNLENILHKPSQQSLESKQSSRQKQDPSKPVKAIWIR